MKARSCVGMIFAELKDRDVNFLLEDRRRIRKHGEDYSFFGGVIEEGETCEGALRREVREELGIEISHYEFFKKYLFIPENADFRLEYFMYISNIPREDVIDVHEKGGLKKVTYSDSLNLNMNEIDKQILWDAFKFLTQKRK